MDSLAEIENAIYKLPLHEVSKLREWLITYEKRQPVNIIDSGNKEKSVMQSGFGMLQTDLPAVDADVDVSAFAKDVIRHSQLG